MRLSCASSRAVVAAVVSYIGAAPIPSATIRDAVVVVAVASALAWPRLTGRASTSCSISPSAPPESSHDERERPSLVTAVTSTEEHHVQ